MKAAKEHKPQQSRVISKFVMNNKRVCQCLSEELKLILDSDIKEIKRLAEASSTPEHLKRVLIDLYENINDFEIGHTDGQAYAVRKYQIDKKSYILKYNMRETNQMLRIGQLVHELTHGRVEKTFNRDFVNYTTDSGKAIPKISLNEEGFVTNEEDIQNSRFEKNISLNITGILIELCNLLQKDSNISQTLKDRIKKQLEYGMQRPHLEYDTVINQIAVWLQYENTDLNKTSFGKTILIIAKKLYDERMNKTRVCIFQ